MVSCPKEVEASNLYCLNLKQYRVKEKGALRHLKISICGDSMDEEGGELDQVTLWLEEERNSQEVSVSTGLQISVSSEEIRGEDLPSTL